MADFVTRNVQGVEIFAAGTWTDAFGMTKSWNATDLDNMVREFEAGQEIPVKVGHTSDVFNLKLASDLGVPIELLTGEFGMGAMGLGKVSSLVRSGDKLVANFIDVPEALASLIEGGNYNAVSVELRFNEDDGPVATGIALLGVEEPAVDVLAPLDIAEIFKKQSPVFAFSNGKLKIDEERMKIGFADSVLKELAAVTKVVDKEEDQGMSMNNDTAIADAEEQEFNLSAEDLNQLWESLGLGQHSDINAILEVIEEFKKAKKYKDDDEEDEEDKNKKPFNKEEDDEEKKKKMTKEEDDDEDKKKMQAALGEMECKIAEQSEFIANLQHEKRVANYAKQAEQWNAIPGTSAEFGEELAEIEETVGEVAVGRMVASYSRANDLAKVAITSSVGSALKSMEETQPTDPFEIEIRKYSKDAGVTYENAVMHFSSTRGKEFDAWHRRSLAGRN